MASSGMLRRVALVKTDVSEEGSASSIIFIDTAVKTTNRTKNRTIIFPNCAKTIHICTEFGQFTHLFTINYMILLKYLGG
jgi:hypothetical protein